ncbi:DUF4037 domain-containing protein [Rhizobium sp. P44RR-XXIV]|uniref:DUF4037 domain-containing protein n=1 Tax=Rhizobium sp. P44RR-XXIV TaxID=1921145 RepID=UPI000987C04B|nr:DUF4037 domain-containing protein [Rhizobium sp. P44RR-XXIV]TIX87694.1 DUF4037 domain-containing protein [Rhizobium sp. P44RR-XXIV]
MSRETELIAAMTPLIADLADDGNGAVALAGSRGKGRSDEQSDFDFRVYADTYRGPELRQTKAWKRFEGAMRAWKLEGVRMDGVWMRRYAGVQNDLDSWLAGSAVPKNFEWTIWGYHLPTDLASQQIIADPRGLLAGWKQQLAQYPEALRATVLRQHMEILRYWAKDYHYESKVARRDLVFLVGLTGKLANAILQTVFAFNRAYFPGDGWNLPMAAELERLPPDFLQRMTAILEPGHDPDTWRRQRTALIGLIGDLEVMIAA